MRRLLVVVVVLLGLLVGADRVAAYVAGRAVAHQLRSSAGLQRDPSVTVTGFPFLTQALRGRYDEMKVHATAVRSEGVRVVVLDARLRGVRVPLSDAVQGRVRSVPVSSLSAQARLSYADLAVDSSSRQLTFSPAPDGAVHVTGRVVLLGLPVTATSLSTLTLQGNTLAVTARSVQVQGGGLSVGGTLGGRLDLKIRLGRLPYGLRPTAVQARPDGVLLQASSGSTVLRPR